MLVRVLISRFIFCVIIFYTATAKAELQVGATITDVTPVELPVLVNGGMTSRSIETIKTRVNARTVVISDGQETIAISVVDSCMLPKSLLDDVKALTANQTQLKPDRILISATHAHSAPSSMGALGTSADEKYIAFLREKLVNSFIDAEKNLEPARVGWGSAQAPDFTAVRRWILRPDRVQPDPFGNPTVRANMHAGRKLEDVTGESGPEDPELSLISFQSLTGRPIAVIANFSMHYFGDRDLSADYFGLFSEGLKQRISPEDSAGQPPFVGMMSHGCSGDIWRRDYNTYDPKQDDFTIESFSEGLLDIAMQAYEQIEYQDADIAMQETRLPLKYRVPNAQRLKWSEEIVEELGDRLPKTREEIYAREQVYLHELQSTEVVVQGIRIGEIGIATTPNETYALTGMKLKKQSPLKQTMVIELANGGDGYIPPPEQHFLGGYNTWAARSAGLEVQAEPKIVAAALHLLERVAEKPAQKYAPPKGAATQAILDLKPVAYWRMNEMAGLIAEDATGNDHHAYYEDGVVYFLEGPKSSQFCKDEINSAAHFAGGRMVSQLDTIGDEYTVSMWCWNGMPVDARQVSGWMFSRGRDQTPALFGEHLGIGGKDFHAGKFILLAGGQLTTGSAEIPRWTWTQIVMTVANNEIKVFVNGSDYPDVVAPATVNQLPLDRLFIGGRCDHASNWEGRIDEVAIFDRILSQPERARLRVSE